MYRRYLIALFMVGVFFANSTKAASTTLRIHCWKGYATPYIEGFKDLVKEKHKINIHVAVTHASDPQEFWNMARDKKADLISPAHNIPLSPSWHFIQGKVLLPVDLGNIPNYRNVLPLLQKNKFVTVKGKVYGVPYTMGPYGLAYNTKKVTEPDSWSVLWDVKAKGRYTLSADYPDCNSYLTALVLGAGYDELYNSDKLFSKISQADFQSRLNTLAANAASFWEGVANPEEFPELSYAATWGFAVAKANSKGGKWKMAKPREGTTMWADHWAVTHAVKDHPEKKKLCEEWINYCLSPRLQVGAIRNWGVSPVVTNINALLTKQEVETFNAGNNEYWKSLSFWQHQEKRTKNTYKYMWEKALKQRRGP